MSEVYSTDELIQILDNERKACLQGERLNLSATPSVGNPVVDCFLKADGIQKFTAYQDFKTAVHQYQIKHQVSGIVWREMTIHNQTLRYPAVDDQLIALSQDVETLKAAKAELLQFWLAVTTDMDLYLSLNGGKDHQPIEAEAVDAIAQRTEWACIWKWEKANFLEMLLQLGWGQPIEASYRRGWPDAGSEYIHAVKPGQQPIC